MLLVVAILARGAPLTETTGRRSLIRERASCEVELGQLTALDVSKQVAVPAHGQFVARRRPERDRAVEALPAPLDVVVQEGRILRYEEPVDRGPVAVGPPEQVGFIMAIRVAAA